jgi:hypothetical protein
MYKYLMYVSRVFQEYLYANSITNLPSVPPMGGRRG